MSEKIKKEDLVKLVHQELKDKNYKLNLTEASEITTTVIDTIINKALEGNEIYLHGTGIIKTKIKKGRIGRNPSTGEKIVIENKKVLTLDISRKFKEKINS